MEKQLNLIVSAAFAALGAFVFIAVPLCHQNLMVAWWMAVLQWSTCMFACGICFAGFGLAGLPFAGPALWKWMLLLVGGVCMLALVLVVNVLRFFMPATVWFFFTQCNVAAEVTTGIYCILRWSLQCCSAQEAPMTAPAIAGEVYNLPENHQSSSFETSGSKYQLLALSGAEQLAQTMPDLFHTFFVKHVELVPKPSQVFSVKNPCRQAGLLFLLCVLKTSVLMFLLYLKTLVSKSLSDTHWVLLCIVFMAVSRVALALSMIICSLLESGKSGVTTSSIWVLGYCKFTIIYYTFYLAIFEHVGSWSTFALLKLVHFVEETFWHWFRARKNYFNGVSRILGYMPEGPMLQLGKSALLWSHADNVLIWQHYQGISFALRTVVFAQAYAQFVLTWCFLRYSYNSVAFETFSAKTTTSYDFQRLMYFMAVTFVLETLSTVLVSSVHKRATGISTLERLSVLFRSRLFMATYVTMFIASWNCFAASRQLQSWSPGVCD